MSIRTYQYCISTTKKILKPSDTKYKLEYLKLTQFCFAADKPGPPINFTFDEIRNTSCICNWEPPEDDGGSEILNYILEKKDNKNDEIGWITVTSTLKGTSFLITKLIEGKEYIFRVTAENKFGCGPPCISEPLVAKNQFGE